jgi:hypothetical protein
MIVRLEEMANRIFELSCNGGLKTKAEAIELRATRFASGINFRRLADLQNASKTNALVTDRFFRIFVALPEIR